MAGIPGIENLGAGLAGMGDLLKYVLYGLVLGGMIYAAWIYLSYNVRVGILERSGKTHILRWKKGKFYRNKKEDGNLIERFKIMGDKRWNQPLQKNYLLQQKKSMGRTSTLAIFAEDKEGRLQPVRPELELQKWKGLSNNAMQFIITDARKHIERFKTQNWMDKYGALIQIGGMALIFIMALVLFREISSASGAFSNAATALQEAGSSLANTAAVCSAAPPPQVIV